MKEFLKSFFSVDERRISSLIVTFMITLGVALVFYSQRGDVTGNLTNILIVYICAIAGVNLPSNIAGLITTTQTYQLGKTAQSNIATLQSTVQSATEEIANTMTSATVNKSTNEIV